MRTAFDIGGTFTDVITISTDGQITTRKVLSLVEHLAADIIESIQLHGWTESFERYVHGTTICSNAVIENTVAKTGLVTTRGFRDTLELRAQRGPETPDIRWRPPTALVPRDLCVELLERVLSDGSVATPLDPRSLESALGVLRAAEVEAIAVCLVNSYVNDAHEQEVAEYLRAQLPDVNVCVSSEIHPEVREYERTSTTVINASLVPIVERYLDRLEAGLSEYSSNVLIMQSNGGIMTSQAARKRPMYMVESGPAAGVLAACRLATEMGLPNVISFDMGGTTAKACLIRNGHPLERTGGEVGAGQTAGGESHSDGHALQVPTFDLVEVGTGGGSIAWVDRGALRVGPRSAGAEPGPVCYRRGGTEPTVTDANVVLGRINPLAIAGGSVELDVTAAREAIARLGERIDLDDTLRVAHGITEVGNVVMMRALRAVSTERGYDPRDFAMVAFGGSGPLHAAALAEQLSISTVVIPPFPGLFSAVGLLLADYRLDYVASVLQDADEVTDDVLCARFAQLEQDAVADFEEMGMGGAKLEFARSVDVRYVYQMEEMPIALPENLREGIGAWVSAEFVASHEREYGYVGSGPKSIVNIRVRATAPADTVSFGDFARGNYDSPSSEPSIRLVYFGPQSGTVTTTIAGRGDFDEPRLGPFVVEEPDATIVIPPGWRVVRHPNSSLILTRESGSPNTGKAH